MTPSPQTTPWLSNAFLPSRPPETRETGYLDENDQPVSATEKQMADLIRKGSKLWYVWTASTPHCVPPESVPTLHDALQAQRKTSSNRQMCMGAGVILLTSLFLFISDSETLRLVAWLLMMLLGIFPLLDGLFQRNFLTRASAAQSLETYTRLEYWMEQQPSPFTKGLVFWLVLLFAVQLISGLPSSIEALGMSTPTLDQGEFWRLGTATLLHGNLPHLIFNAYAITYLSKRVELFAGWQSSLFIFVSTALLGMLASDTLGDGKSYSVGASGGICGLLAWLLVHYFRNTTQLTFSFAWPLLLGMLSLISLGILLPNVDNLGHGAGFAAGLLLGTVSSQRNEPVRHASRWVRWLGVLALLLIAGLSVQILRTLLLA